MSAPAEHDSEGALKLVQKIAFSRPSKYPPSHERLSGSQNEIKKKDWTLVAQSWQGLDIARDGADRLWIDRPPETKGAIVHEMATNR